MKCSVSSVYWLVMALLSSLAAVPSLVHAESPLEYFVAVNGVQLQVLDWGGRGAPLIFIHGLGDDPHSFNDIAPDFTDRFHVIAYARRGFGSSSGDGPYDIATLTEDLHGLMDSLGIAAADLAGVSAGGDEITEMAARYPRRVHSIVYLEAGYDWADPDFHAAIDALPATAFDRPVAVMRSLDAFRAYQQALWYPDLKDMRRVEPLLLAKIVIQRDGSVKDRIPKERINAHFAGYWTNKPRNYHRVICPALLIYAQSLYDLDTTDLNLREKARAWETTYWNPFRAKSIERARRELSKSELVAIPGAHVNFLFMQKASIVKAMRRFLDVPTLATTP
jgi:pimeloyl-ACP methyl ester carboxylesterase